MIHPSDIGALRFAHQAMNTEFEIFCVHADGDYAQQACWAAFDLLDRLENELSRFIPNSDISRINHLSAGERVRVSRWTMECLDLARQAYDETGGAFDISLGTGFATLQFSPRDCLVGGLKPANAVRLDLGGIGKGYALDRMAEVLSEWDIRQALLHGGHSSVLALDPPPGLDGWPLTMGERTLAAKRRAFSASGIRTQGGHIVDPRTGLAASGRVAAWVSLELGGSPSPSAVAEAYSTAFMILPATEVDAIRARHPGLEAWFLDQINEVRNILCVRNSD
jgi:thiamine biosynthesis lipoprotein